MGMDLMGVDARMLTRSISECTVCEHRSGRYCPHRPERDDRRRARKNEKRAAGREIDEQLRDEHDAFVDWTLNTPERWADVPVAPKWVAAAIAARGPQEVT